MSAEAIARVVADLKAGRLQINTHDVDDYSVSAAKKLSNPGPVVDATLIYESLVANHDPIHLYEDHPSIAPPWESALICYVNEHGNVVVMQLASIELPAEYPDLRKKRWETAQEIDWTQVRWLVSTNVWVGGSGAGGSIPVPYGPMHAWRFAIYEDGQPADLGWIQLSPDYPMKNWDMAHLILLGTLNFLNCRNVEVVEPRRPRAEARRIERTGVRVSTINVFSMGKQYEGNGKGREGGTPLTSVRGHFASYGPEYGKGKLFGKYSGRFWIPQFARGDKEAGEVEQQYKLRPTS